MRDVDVQLENGNILWLKEVEDEVSTRSIFVNFCQAHGLDPATCRLNHNGVPLGDQAVAQVEPDLTSTLKLTVAFKCTNAFSAWQRLNLAESNMGHSTPELWLQLAEVLATECGWSLLEMDDQLDAFVSVTPLAALPDAMMNDSTRQIYWWESVSKPSRPLMLLLDTYMHALGMLHLDDVPKTVHYAAMQSVISCTNYIRSRQPGGKPSELDLLVSLAPTGYITYLRSALLLIKLISLLSSLPSEDNEVVFQSTQILCEALTTLCSKMQSMDTASSGKLELAGFSLEDGHSLNRHKTIAVKLAGSGVVTTVLASLGISREAANKAVDFVGLLLSHKLPFELVDATEALLVRLQAVARLAPLLCPPFPCKDEIVHMKVSKVYPREWHYKEAGDPVPRMTNVAKIINRLLVRSPAPSDPTQALPTPTPAAWEFIKLTRAKVQTTHEWLWSEDRGATQGLGRNDVQLLNRELLEVANNLIVGHMPNLKLDVADHMRAYLLPLLKAWTPFQDAAKPLKNMGFAYIRRLGRDRSILAVKVNTDAHAAKEQPKDKAKSKGKAKKAPRQQKVECHGCDVCYDSDWQFKVKTVAKLWSMFCYQASTCPEAAAVTVDALHAAVAHEELCKHLLLGTHQVEEGLGLQLGFDTAIKSLQGNLTAQLTAAACWARMYSQALMWVNKGVPAKDAWAEIGTDARACADQVLDVVQAAVLEPVPWSTERCVAITRILLDIGQLKTAIAHQSEALFDPQKDTRAALSLLVHLLPKLPEVTTIVALQHQLLMPSIAWAMPVLHALNSGALPDCSISEELISVTLTDTLVHFIRGEAAAEASAGASAEASAEATAHFSDTGLPMCLKGGLQLLILRAAWLSVNDRVAYQYFGQHAAVLCMAWFVQHSESGRWPDLLTTAHSLDQDEVLPDLEPCFQICAQYGRIRPEGGPAPPAAAFTAVQYVLVRLVQRHMKLALHIQKVRGSNGGKRPAPRDASAATVSDERAAANLRHLLDAALRSVESMRQDPLWVPVIAGLKDHAWCSGDKKAAADFTHLLTGTGRIGNLSAAVAQRVQACLLPLGSGSVDRTEASAETALQQLMAEEDEAAAKAAAKRAKKLKQKLKKQQGQQSLSHSEEGSSSPDTASKPEGSPSQGSDEGLPLAALDIDDTLEEGTPRLHTAQGDGSQGQNDRALGQLETVSAIGQDGDFDFIQSIFSCPITKVTMVEPVIAADGHTYERAALEEWLLQHVTSPVTGDFLPHTRIVPNVLIKSAIQTNTAR
ncbi:hypothetical protein WJX79_008213 [Trebouxia sp. C0005]